MKERTSHISPKTKKILVSVGVGFGTIMVFLVSFVLAFSLIVNPINFFTISDADTVKENEELKNQVQTLEDEVEVLNTTVEKYKNSAAVQRPVSDTPATVTTPAQEGGQNSGSSQTSDNATTNEGTSSDSNAQNEEPASTDGEGTSDAEEGSFSPETVTSTQEGTPEDVEEPITVIEVN